MATQAAKLMLPVGTNNSYLQALSIPLDDFQHFSLAELAWLRYVAFTIHGRKGYISSTPARTVIEADGLDGEIEEKEYCQVFDPGLNNKSGIWNDHCVSQGVSHVVV